MISFDSTGGLPVFKSDMIKVPHFFTTRLGGVSTQKEYKELNLGVRTDDSFENVSENYRRVKAMLGIEKLVLAKQEHTNRVLVVGKNDLGTGEIGNPSFPFGVDALLTNSPDVALGVFTADCIPVLLYDSEKSVIGAVHSGWRGTLERICVNAVHLMQEKFSCENIAAVIGPSIKSCCFEIGDDVAQLFKKAYPDFYGEILKPYGERFKADTSLCVEHDLKEAGVKIIDKCDVCTYCNNDLLFSHRRGDKARQLAVIKNELQNN